MSSNNDTVKYSHKQAEALAKKQDPVARVLETTLTFAEKNAKVLFIILVLIVIAGIGYGINDNLTMKKEATFQERYAQAEKEQLEKERNFEEADRAPLAPEKDKKPEPKISATGDLEKDFGSSVKIYNEVIREAPQTKAARMAAIKLSDLYLKYKKPDDAMNSLKEVAARMHNDLTGYLVTFQKANVQSQIGQCSEAVSTWETLVRNKHAAFLHKEAQVRMGLCYETMKDFAKAELMYIEASKKDERDDFGPAKDAEKYLRLLKLRKTESKGS